jgi:hypothetical protein
MTFPLGLPFIILLVLLSSTIEQVTFPAHGNCQIFNIRGKLHIVSTAENGPLQMNLHENLLSSRKEDLQNDFRKIHNKNTNWLP